MNRKKGCFVGAVEERTGKVGLVVVPGVEAEEEPDRKGDRGGDGEQLPPCLDAQEINVCSVLSHGLVSSTGCFGVVNNGIRPCLGWRA